jgi:hypothetical protein
MDMSRGSTTIGNGTVSAYVYLPIEAFNVDYFTEIDVVLSGSHKIYTEAYNDMLILMAERMQPDVEVIANERLVSLKADALKQYEEGYKEYADGLAEFEAARDDTLRELADALAKLEDGQKEIDTNRETLADGLKKLDDAQKEIDKKQAEESAMRKNQIGSGDRSEKIRTYNFPQSRCTDHRIKLTLYRLGDIMNGDLDEIIDSLIAADQAAKLSQLDEAS